ncbi:hypothetical protein DRQ25_16745 [Candidatus Fermentibacteria bacterium]|nr:MAG: hypothetical protein DRQ25_16745 [Candidatus Fermentibacteria bacterium]
MKFESRLNYVILYRSDFRTVQDGSGDSFFDDLLNQLGIKEPNRFDRLELNGMVNGEVSAD